MKQSSSWLMIMIASVLSSRRRKDHSGLITDWPRLMTRPARCNCVTHPRSCQLEEIYPRSLSSSSSSFYHLLITDEGPETGDESDEDIVRSYLPGEGLGGGYLGDNNHNIPAINITLHSPSTNHVLGESPVSQSSEAVMSLCASKPMFIATYISCDIKWSCDAIGTIVHLITVEPHLVIQSGQILQIVEVSCLLPCALYSTEFQHIYTKP